MEACTRVYASRRAGACHRAALRADPLGAPQHEVQANELDFYEELLRQRGVTTKIVVIGPGVRRDDTEYVALPRRLRRLAATVGGGLIGDPRVMRAIGQAGQRLAAAEEEFRTGGIADRPMTGRLIQFQQ